MPHRPQPFFRRDRGKDRGWYVQLGKQQIKLADGSENPATLAAAWEQFHRLMAARADGDKTEPQTTHPSIGPSVWRPPPP